MSQMEVHGAHKFEELDMHAEAWDRLSSVAPQRSPVLSHAWVRSYLEHLLKPGEKWFCLFAYEDQELVGVLPVIIRQKQSALYGGKRFQAPSDPDVWTGDMLVASGRELETAAALLDGFARREPAHAVLRLSKLPPESPSFRVMQDGFGGCRILKEPNGYGSYLKINGSHEAYVASLSSNFRSNLKKAGKRLNRLGRNDILFLSNEDITEEHIQQFFGLEASGWKGRAGSAILSSKRHTGFFTNLIRRLRARGMLECHFLKVEGKLLAGHLAVRTQSKLTLWKIAYDEEYARYAPGNILLERLMHRVHEEGATDEIDLITNFPWHSNWGAQKRPYQNLIISAPRLVPYLGNLVSLKANASLRLLRERVKKSPKLSAVAYGVRDLVRRAGL
ncbi:GNAT family N-acetyltransferase [Desulfocurvibacter africanus]|uniref:GNAT family N-acetyltransferase n=1 Tax=Desulfocurvibacter africanus TaxID=873 RepID=UPI000416F71B|nr:GNAT family N-acetyltransferase [Desulfocurvibacter africanus]